MEFPSQLFDLLTKAPICREIIELYVNLCQECELKKGRAKKGIVVKPIVSKEQNERCQVDLIDLQACPDEDYKFIMVYQVSSLGALALVRLGRSN